VTLTHDQTKKENKVISDKSKQLLFIETEESGFINVDFKDVQSKI
jgi:hypothetical protein